MKAAVERRLFVAAFAILVAGWPAWAQPITNNSLTGEYHFVQLLATTSGGFLTEARNLGGTIVFDGSGGYTFSGKVGVNSAAAVALNGEGTYVVAPDGGVLMSSPVMASLQVRAGLSRDFRVLLGASTEAIDNTSDLLFAVKAPAGNATNALLNGSYTGASLQFPNGSTLEIGCALVSLRADGSGSFDDIRAKGHAADQLGLNVSQLATLATYGLNADGTGTVSFGEEASLLSGQREIFVSQGGDYILGYSTGADSRDILVAAKDYSLSAEQADFEGRYWIAELTFDGFSSSSASGTLAALPGGRAILAERLHLDTSALDFSGLNFYAVNPDSSGALGPAPEEELVNMSLGAGDDAPEGERRPNAIIGAQIGILDTFSDLYGVFLGARAPEPSGAGVFLAPSGVVNGATFAPTPHPISPGAIASLFGTGLADDVATASTIPLPTMLGSGVSVTVNGIPAPLFDVRPRQVNIQVPFEVTGAFATVRVSNASGESNAVTVPLAPTSPGIFTWSDGETPNRGVILHGDYAPVTPENPALRGETVILWLTGLGALHPVGTTGSANPLPPGLASAVDPEIMVFFGGEPAPRPLVYAGGAPAFVGLNQINAVIPMTAPIGDNVPVALSTSTAFTDLVDIAIGY